MFECPIFVNILFFLIKMEMNVMWCLEYVLNDSMSFSVNSVYMNILEHVPRPFSKESKKKILYCIGCESKHFIFESCSS